MTAKVPQVRLDRLLANLGYGSRREVAALVMHRQVELDGVALRDAGARIALTPDRSARMRAISSQNCRRASGSTPVVGSSRISRSGS